MNLDTAIEIIRKDIDNPGMGDLEDLIEAEELGIEALKREQSLRDRWPHQSHLTLPSETKE